MTDTESVFLTPLLDMRLCSGLFTCDLACEVGEVAFLCFVVIECVEHVRDVLGEDGGCEVE